MDEAVLSTYHRLWSITREVHVIYEDAPLLQRVSGLQFCFFLCTGDTAFSAPLNHASCCCFSTVELHCVFCMINFAIMEALSCIRSREAHRR